MRDNRLEGRRLPGLAVVAAVFRRGGINAAHTAPGSPRAKRGESQSPELRLSSPQTPAVSQHSICFLTEPRPQGAVYSRRYINRSLRSRLSRERSLPFATAIPSLIEWR